MSIEKKKHYGTGLKMQTDEPGSVASIDDIPNVSSIIYFFCQCEQNKLMWLYNEELHCNFHGKMEILFL